MLCQELLDSVGSHQNRWHFDRFWSPVRPGLHDIWQERSHVVALRIAVLPRGRGHEALFDVPPRLRVAFAPVDRDVLAVLCPQRPNRADGRIVPAAPDRQALLASRMRGQPSVGVLRAVLEIAGYANPV